MKVTVIRESRSVDVARNHTTGSNGDGERRALDAPIGEVPIADASLDDISIGDSPIQAA